MAAGLAPRMPGAHAGRPSMRFNTGGGNGCVPAACARRASGLPLSTSPVHAGLALQAQRPRTARSPTIGTRWRSTAPGSRRRQLALANEGISWSAQQPAVGCVSTAHGEAEVSTGLVGRTSLPRSPAGGEKDRCRGGSSSHILPYNHVANQSRIRQPFDPSIPGIVGRLEEDLGGGCVRPATSSSVVAGEDVVAGRRLGGFGRSRGRCHSRAV
jgi:hypothetical protein